MPIAIPQADPKAAYLASKTEIDAAIARTLASGRYILGEEVAAFEREFAAFQGARHAVAVANGTAALVLILKALGIGRGDGVATVAHTAVATVAAIELAGATPVLLDIDTCYGLDPERLSALFERPLQGLAIKAVLPVHLYGQAADMAGIDTLARRHGATIVEDASQAHGATLGGKPVGSWGAATAFSLYPTKNLGAIGDGGAITTNDDELAARLRSLREYGWRQRRYISEEAGDNSRLDELQAAILRVKLARLAQDNRRRGEIAALYDAGLGGCGLELPERRPGAGHVFHQYVVASGERDALRAALEAEGIGTNVHYPMPVHLQPAYAGRVLLGPGGCRQTERAAERVLSLPMFPQLSDADAQRAAETARRIAARL